MMENKKEPPASRADALRMVKAFRDRGDASADLRHASAILSEAAELLVSARSHLKSASTETVFAIGALYGEIGNVKARVARDIDERKAQADLMKSLEEMLGDAADAPGSE